MYKCIICATYTKKMPYKYRCKKKCIFLYVYSRGLATLATMATMATMATLATLDTVDTVNGINLTAFMHKIAIKYTKCIKYFS